MICSVFILLLCSVFVLNYRIVRVSGDSMSPTLNDGQILIASKDCSEIRYDDIVITNVSGYGTVIKRVFALTGDTIQSSDGKLVVNSLILDNYHYDSAEGKITLSEGEIFILGDNSCDSIDSRIFGAVCKENIIAVIHNQKE